MANIRIAAAIGSQHGITLYLEDGLEMNLPPTSWRTKAIMDDILERLALGQVVEIDTETYSIEARVEKETKGLLRFAMKTKSFIKGLFAKVEDDAERIVLAPADPAKVDPAPEQTAAIARVIPVSVQTKPDPEPELETELVAIVTDKKTGVETIIPGVVALEKHVESAVVNKNVVGLQRFMERLAAMQTKRSHTVQELLRFMERGDLPIADDGCIVAYKVLKTYNDNVFVDCHSGKVQQRVGSKVMQAESLIDQNRRNECSTGLHIARRGYLKSFSGNIITIVKVAPEDVVAVPDYDANKMRAAAYHIVALVPPEVHAILRANKPMTENFQASRMLADVIAGNHVGVTSITEITAAMGGSFHVTPIIEGEAFETGKAGFARALDAPVESLKPAEIRKSVEAVIERQKEEIRAIEPSKTQAAAESGDLSAAISAPAEPAPAPVTKPESKKADPKPKTAKAPQKPVVKADTQPTDKKAAALKLHAEGKSNRQIEAEVHICRKTLKKLFDKNGLKPNG